MKFSGSKNYVEEKRPFVDENNAFVDEILFQKNSACISSFWKLSL